MGFWKSLRVSSFKSTVIYWLRTSVGFILLGVNYAVNENPVWKLTEIVGYNLSLGTQGAPIYY